MVWNNCHARASVVNSLFLFYARAARDFMTFFDTARPDLKHSAKENGGTRLEREE